MTTMMGNSTEAAARAAMVVSQLRTTAVNDPRVIAAMADVPREAFVATEAAELAYRDRPVPLGAGREQNPPLATGRLLTAAELSPHDKVLLIGAGRGYTAAVLAELVAQVVAVESEAELAAAARSALADAGNVTIVEGALTDGAADHGPYDVLIVDGAVEQLPDALVAQVKTGGRVLAGLIDGGVARLASGVKSDGFALVPFADIDCVTLPGFERPRAFHFPG
ncbi:protein-L-isoaspartate O-methyltransferase [uncultured Sphingomonas sp.]|uniref:protein-L-isoaspartate O-methyltransferase family protein n=1 Tax=uncultured Sphingomonas sp. TaxID=158754 RepID=UPI0037480FC9